MMFDIEKDINIKDLLFSPKTYEFYILEDGKIAIIGSTITAIYDKDNSTFTMIFKNDGKNLYKNTKLLGTLTFCLLLPTPTIKRVSILVYKKEDEVDISSAFHDIEDIYYSRLAKKVHSDMGINALKVLSKLVDLEMRMFV